jgi:hypothetical protein
MAWPRSTLLCALAADLAATAADLVYHIPLALQLMSVKRGSSCSCGVERAVVVEVEAQNPADPWNADLGPCAGGHWPELGLCFKSCGHCVQNTSSEKA